MKTAIATRFRCSRPLTDLFKMTLMFITLIFQYLNKLVEGEVRDFASPQAFHTVKVQGFKSNRIKLLTQFRGELPMKVFALVADFPIEACDCSDTPPPAVRAFDFTRKFFIQRPKFAQRLLQRLWVLDFLTRAQCQISVFHAEVCPNAFTCCRQRFEICISRRDTKPIVSAIITFDCNGVDSPVPVAVFMKRIRHFVKLPFTRLWIPFTKRQRDTTVFQRPPRLTRIGDRLKLVSLFDFRSTAKFFEKSVVCFMNASQFLLDRLTWQGVPMRVCGAFQLFRMVIHSTIVHIRQPVFMSLTLPLMKILMHLPHIVKQVANANCIRLFPQRVFIGFHRTIKYQVLTPAKWVADTLPSDNALHVCQLDTYIKPHF